jgi:serine/tyrosine/threonine adenylyltransferase
LGRSHDSGLTLLPLIDENVDAAVEAATDAVQSFGERYDGYLISGTAAKLGLAEADRSLIGELLALLESQQVDWTRFFRALSDHLRGRSEPARTLCTDPLPS